MVKSEVIEALLYCTDGRHGPRLSATTKSSVVQCKSHDHDVDDDVASNLRSLVQVAEQPHPLLPQRPPANRV